MSPKQLLFVQEYLIDLNATQAAKRAGYSVKTCMKTGYELLQKPLVQEAIQEAMAQRVKRTQVTQDDILRELARVVFFDKRRLLTKEGKPRPIHELDDDTAAGLAEINVYEAYSGYGDHRYAVGQRTKFKAYDKVAALALYMRHLGMFKDKVEHSGHIDGVPQLTINLTK